MSHDAHGGPVAASACTACVRRSWLLSELSGPLDFCARERTRLLDVLALDDGELLRALAGRRRDELGARFAAFDAGQLSGVAGGRAVCEHGDAYPEALRGVRGAPRLLNVTGGQDPLANLQHTPVVAVLGSRRPSDYGVSMARSLARGLAASGLTVVCALDVGIAAAALSGALEVGTRALAVRGAGLAVEPAASTRRLHARLLRRGCVVSELPPGCSGRRWGTIAAERIVADLASVAVVVEAEETAADLASAQLARKLERRVAAIPGRVTSPLSTGAHALLMEGASLVRGAGDVLELVSEDEGCAPARAPSNETVKREELEPRLARILAQVGAGLDTPERLMDAGVEEGETLLALSELELMGLLARADGGRYAPREPWR